MADNGLDEADLVRRAEAMVHHAFGDRALLELALTHASRADKRLESNERLEFLGDAILGMIVCEYLFESYPHLEEGDLTKIKSTVVSRETCADLAEEMGLDELIRLGKGMSNRGDMPRSLSAGAFEAVLGALYLDAGFGAARQFIRGVVKERIDIAVRCGHQQNFKSVLQQIAQQTMSQSPQYIMLDEKGPDHAKCFEICVEIGSRRFKSCWGRSKKAAEQQAALLALLELGHVETDSDEEVRLRAVATRTGDDEVIGHATTRPAAIAPAPSSQAPPD